MNNIRKPKAQLIAELEAAQRAARVEAALERVRARALGMGESGEIKGVATALRNEFENLGYPIDRMAIRFIDEEANAYEQWAAGPLTPRETDFGEARVFKLDRRKKWFKEWKNGVRSWTQKTDLDVVRARTRQMMKGRPKREVQARLNALPEALYDNFLNFESGLISFEAGTSFTDDDFEVAARFVDVSAFAYRRFLELKEKEQRAREAEVEAALERVRAQALAMQDTSGLGAVTDLLYAEVQSLGFDLHWLSLNAIDHSGMRTTWSAGERHTVRGWRVPAKRPARSQFWKRVAEEAQAARARGDESHIIQVKGRQVRSLVHGLLLAQGKSQEEIDERLEDLPPTLVSHRVFHEHGLVAYVREHPLDDEQAAIAKRFTDVFDFAYKRFLDLQAKERRAREAEVEAALERVRSQALAMQTSEDIPAVSAAVFRELETLKFPAMNTLIGIPDQARNLTTQWVVLPEELEGWDIVYRGDPLVALEQFDLDKLYSVDPSNRRLKASPTGKPVYLPHRFSRSEFEEVAKRYVELGQWSAEKAEATMDAVPEGFYFPAVQHKHGYLAFVLKDPLKESEIEEAKRLAETFAFAYDRFLDLQDKERRAREAEVEAALERVRAQALSMQSTEDLPSVSSTLFHELNGLRFPVTASIVAVIHEDRDLFEQWTTFPPMDEHIARQMGTVYTEQDPPVIREHFGMSNMFKANPWGKQIYETWQKTGQTVFAGRYSPREVAKVWDAFVRLGEWPKAVAEYQKQRLGDDDFHMTCVFYKHGYVAINHFAPLNDFEIESTKRFAEVFGFAYDRFLELDAKQKANRELQVEAALERVRARALGMQESQELSDVALILREELLGLEVPLGQVCIAMRPDPENVELWFPPGYGLEFRVIQDRLDAFCERFPWADGTLVPSDGEDCSYELTQEEIEDWNAYYYAILEESGADVERPDITGLRFGLHNFHFPKGNLSLSQILWNDDRPDAMRFPDEDMSTARRFADVFAFAHSRFLELKEKEDQNRELTIQNALERVRARAEGMQESSDLQLVVGALTEEVQSLGIPAAVCSILLIDHETGIARWSVQTPGVMFPWQSVSLDTLRTIPSNARALDAHERGDSYFFDEMDTKEARKYLQFWCELLWEVTPEERDRGVPPVPEGARIYNFNFQHGWVYLHVADVSGDWGEPGFELPLGDPLSDDEIATMRRFADVFEYAYGRFRELEEKEAQNRELTIQNALERVRAQAQGMQESEEIAGVAKAIYDRFQGLGYGLERANIIVTSDKEGTKFVHWDFSPVTVDVRDLSEEEQLSRKPATRPRDEDPDIIRRHEEARERGDWYFVLEIEGDALRENRRIHGRSWGLKGAALRTFVNRKPLQEHRHFVFHAHGAISFVRAERMSEEDLRVAKRFTDVFDYAYDRFQELKEKEEQNRELTIQNALERVRARALGMQESQEIMEVARLNFEEMMGLGYEIWRSDIFFFSVEEGYFDFYGTQDPEAEDGLFGEASTFHSRYSMTHIREYMDKHRHTRVAWATIERGEGQFTVQMEGDELQSWYGDVLQAMVPELDREAHIPTLPTALTDHRFFINDPAGPSDSGGAVDFFVKEPLDEAGIAVARRFADTFEFAYSRFRELQEKEAQNRELEEANRAMSEANKELFAANQALQRDSAVERIRGEVQAMEQASDFERVLSVLAEDLKTVGLSFDTCEIDVLDEPVDAPTMAYFEGHGFRYTTYAIQPDSTVTSESYHNPAPFPTVIRETIERFIEGEPWQGRSGQTAIVEVPASNYGRLRITSSERQDFTEEDIDALQDFASAIALGYARYLDIREIQEQTERKSAFMASMSHEIRTPMNAIIGFTRMVLRREVNISERNRENLQKVRISADHLLDLINGILDLSKIEAGRTEVNAERFDVKETIAACCAEVEPLVEAKPGVKLEYTVSEDVGEADTDPGRLRQIAINLLSNALKFTNQGEVAVRVSKDGASDGESLVIAVSDTGTGIPEDALESIFEEFQQVKGSDPQHKGTGLGLPITKGFAELLGGNISVQSQVGKGSTFTVRVPVVYRES